MRLPDDDAAVPADVPEELVKAILDAQIPALNRNLGCRVDHPSGMRVSNGGSSAHEPSRRAAAIRSTGEAGRKVTWLELFFDLIFVAAVARSRSRCGTTTPSPG